MWIRPLATYGCIAFISASKSRLNQLQVIQNKALKFALRKPWRTSIKTLHEEAKIETLKDLFQRLSLKYLSRSKELELLGPTLREQQFLQNGQVQNRRTRAPLDVLDMTNL